MIFALSVLLLIGFMLVLSIHSNKIAKIIFVIPIILLLAFEKIFTMELKNKAIVLSLRYMSILVMLMISMSLILIIVSIIISFPSIEMSKALTLNLKAWVISWITLWINNNSASLAVFGILLFLFVEYHLYKVVLTIIIKKIEYSKFNPETYRNVQKYLLADFTVITIFLGLVPLVIDQYFANLIFSEEMKETLLIYFICAIVPYIHLTYHKI